MPLNNDVGVPQRFQRYVCIYIYAPVTVPFEYTIYLYVYIYTFLYLYLYSYLYLYPFISKASVLSGPSRRCRFDQVASASSDGPRARPRIS